MTTCVRNKVNNAKLTFALTNAYNWESLTDLQRDFLAPLKSQWEKLDSAHRIKWVKVAARLESQPGSVRRRAQEKMLVWIKMSALEKKLARTYFAREKTVDRKIISKYWIDYQNLPPEQKLELAAHSLGVHGITNIFHE